MNDPNDGLDSLLTRPTAPCNEALRRSLLAETTNVLRLQRRWRRRRIVGGIAAAASVVLAIVGVAFVQRSGVPEGPYGLPNPSVSSTPVLSADTPAAVIERIGETSPPDQRPALYRRAGDRYLVEAADPQEALRCYTQALDDGSEAELNVSADDSWLLMALKIDRKKEKKNANRD